MGTILICLLAALGDFIGMGSFGSNILALLGVFGGLFVVCAVVYVVVLVVSVVKKIYHFLSSISIRESMLARRKKMPQNIRQNKTFPAHTERGFVAAEFDKGEKTNTDKEPEEKKQDINSLKVQLGAHIGNDALRQCGGVYVISRCDEGVVKVGMTKDFSRRFPRIQSVCRSAGIPEITPEILVPVDSDKAEDVEAAVHEQLSEDWEAGEWFRVPVEEAVNAVLSAAWQQRNGNLEPQHTKPWQKPRRIRIGRIRSL